MTGTRIDVAARRKAKALREVGRLYDREVALLAELEQVRAQLPEALAVAAAEGARKAELRAQVGDVARQSFQRRYGADLERLVEGWASRR